MVRNRHVSSGRQVGIQYTVVAFPSLVLLICRDRRVLCCVGSLFMRQLSIVFLLSIKNRQDRGRVSHILLYIYYLKNYLRR